MLSAQHPWWAVRALGHPDAEPPVCRTRTFACLSYYTWRQVGSWLRRKHRRSTWKDLRRRYCDAGWWPALEERPLFNPAKVATMRYRYRGTVIPTPWPNPERGQHAGPEQGLRSARCSETGTPGAEAVRGNGPVDKAGTARRIDFTTYISAVMRTFTGAHPDWLTVIQLPAYAPDLNPAEDAWANMKNGLGNLAAPNVSDLAAIVKTRLKSIQYRPGLISGFLGQTGLTLEPEPP